jgi:hypothetical protein
MRNSVLHRLLLAALLFIPASFAGAVYEVDLDTSSVSGTDGAIYFAFTPGPAADTASITISPFSVASPGTLLSTPAPATTGDVTGALDALPLIIGNTNGLNDYLHHLTFGDAITFRVTFNLPSTLTGDAGSAFVVQLTSSDGISPILTDDPSGNVVQIEYDTQPVFTAQSLSAIATVFNPVPEPGSLILLSLGMTALIGLRRRRAC